MRKKGAILLLFLIFVLLWGGMLFKTTVTIDEPNYITAGYSYWKTADFRMNSEHPPLAKLLAGIPLLFLAPNMSFSESWESAKNPENAYKEQWKFSSDFFYNSGNDPETLLILARIPFLFLAILLGYYVWKWATVLYAEHAGILALFLYSFCPIILAYSTLAITDFAFACFFCIALYYFWVSRKEKSKKAIILCSLFFGFALATKLTAIYLLPLFSFLYWYEEYCKQEALENNSEKNKDIWKSIREKSGFFLNMTLKITVSAILILILCYFIVNIPLYFTAFKITAIHVTEGHAAYLFGMHSQTGWWYYFIVAFLVKTPIPLLIFFFWAIYIFWKKGHIKKTWHDDFFLLFPIVIYFILCLFQKINIGIRHLLPIYPLLIIFASSICSERNNKKYSHLFFIVLLLWYAFGTLWAYPDEIAYFNEFVGGPNNGQKILLDSNMDWGQDVAGVKDWMEKNNENNKSYSLVSPVSLSLFSYEPIERFYKQNKQIKCFPYPGIFIVSVNHLYDLSQTRQGCLDWLKEREPAEKIGYSIFVYNVTDPELVAQESLCLYECPIICLENNKTYQDWGYKKECICECK